MRYIGKLTSLKEFS